MSRAKRQNIALQNSLRFSVFLSVCFDVTNKGSKFIKLHYFGTKFTISRFLDSEPRKFVKLWIYDSNNYRFCWMSCFLLGGLFVRSLTDRFRLFIMQPNGRFVKLFLMDIIILNFINDELKSSDKKLPSQDSSIKQTIEKLIQSFENHRSVNWYCKK